MAQSKTYLDADGNEIKGTGTYLDESGSVVGPNPRAVGGDTINGRDPNAPPSLTRRIANRLAQSAEPAANPRTVLDFANLVTATGGGMGIPTATELLSKATGAIAKGTGAILQPVGRSLKTLGELTQPHSVSGAVLDVALRHNPTEAALALAGPTTARIAGAGLERTGGWLRSGEPLLQFEAPVVKVARPSASVVEAAQEAAPAVTDAVASSSKTVKPILNAMEMKEYMRLTRAGKSHAEAMDLIHAQNELAKRLNLPSSEKVRQAVQSRNDTVAPKAEPAASIPTPKTSSPLDQFEVTPAELKDAVKWHQQGVAPEVIRDRILQARLFTGRMGTATPEEAAAKIESSFHTGKF